MESKTWELAFQYGGIGAMAVAFAFFIRYLVMVQIPREREAFEKKLDVVINAFAAELGKARDKFFEQEDHSRKDFKEELAQERADHDRWRQTDIQNCEKRHGEQMAQHSVTQQKIDMSRHSLRNAIQGKADE